MTTFWRGAVLGAPGLGAGRSARRAVMAVAATGLAVACAGLLTGAGAALAAGARTGHQQVRWGRAERLRGNPLISGGDAYGQTDFVTSLSCGSPNNCAAGGTYYSSADYADVPFVVAELKGRWARAKEVPGIAAMSNSVPYKASAGLSWVSCAPGGYCVAGGFYTDTSGDSQGFVVTFANGLWQTATGRTWPGGL